MGEAPRAAWARFKRLWSTCLEHFTALTARRRRPQPLNTNAHAPASTTLVCANSMRRATIEADSPRRHGARARVYCARVQARSISAGTCGPTTAHSASRTRARLATRSAARSGQKLATLTGFAKHLLEEEPSHRAQQRIPPRRGDRPSPYRRPEPAPAPAAAAPAAAAPAAAVPRARRRII